MKNSLLLCYLLLTTSNLVAMKLPKIVNTKIVSDSSNTSPETKKPLPSIKSSITSIKAHQEKTVKTCRPHYEQFLKACRHGDELVIKQYLKSDSITAQDITDVLADSTLDTNIKQFISLAQMFLYTDSVETIEAMIKANKAANPFLFISYIPRLFEIASQAGHYKVVKYLLMQRSSSINDELLRNSWNNIDALLGNRAKLKARFNDIQFMPTNQMYEIIRETISSEITERFHRAADAERKKQYEQLMRKAHEMKNSSPIG